MIYVVNYASGRFLQAQRIQNAGWRRLSRDLPVTICSYSAPDVIPILQDLRLDNEDDIRRVLREKRGDGLWAWKAILNYHVYKNIAREGDVVFYLDSGAQPIARFTWIWEHIRANGHLFVRVSALDTVESVRAWLQSVPSMSAKASLVKDFSCKLWMKPLALPRCVLDRLERSGATLLDECPRLLQMEQVCGGIQGYLKREGNDTILKDLLANTSLDFFGDEPRAGAGTEYVAHRHDQSLLSLIVNAETIRNPAFSGCVLNHMPQVRLSRLDGIPMLCKQLPPGIAYVVLRMLARAREA
jgi:hypothetical protein